MEPQGPAEPIDVALDREREESRLERDAALAREQKQADAIVTALTKPHQ